MQKDFILPDIGEGIVECEVIEWKIKEGDRIEEDQIVVDVSTDKAIVEIPSMYNGRITRLHYAEGDTAKVHEPLFAIELDGEEAAVAESLPEKAAAPAEQAVAVPSSVIASDAVTSDNTVNQKVLSTPAVRKMAREHQLDLATIVGTGRQGRVLKEDILGFLVGANQSSPSSTTAGISPVMEERVEP